MNLWKVSIIAVFVLLISIVGAFPQVLENLTISNAVVKNSKLENSTLDNNINLEFNGNNLAMTSRFLDTLYYNNNTFPIVIQGVVYIHEDSISGGGDYYSIIINGTYISYHGIDSMYSGTFDIEAPFFAIIPSGASYMLQKSVGIEEYYTLVYWYEWPLKLK